MNRNVRPALLESGATPETKNVVTARKPPQPIPGGQAGPGLLAWLLTSRFCDHLPYHRQERIFERHGLRFSRQTTCDWARRTAELCRPIYDLLIAEVLRSYVLHSDDTPVTLGGSGKRRAGSGTTSATRSIRSRCSPLRPIVRETDPRSS